MIAQASNITTEQTIYTCPTGKRGMVEVYMYSSDSPLVELKVNSITVISMPLSGTLSIKLVLDQGDTIAASSDTSSPANVIVSGMLL